MKEKRTIIRPNEIGIRNKCTLCSKRYANSKKEVYFYAESMEDNDDIQFNIEYHTEYSNGELQDGYAYVDIEELAEAYRMNDFNEIKQYFIYGGLGQIEFHFYAVRLRGGVLIGLCSCFHKA